MFTDYYRILNISPNASLNEIKEAYKREVKIWHPDVNKSEKATCKMQKINEAYLILKDPEAKRLYDIEYVRYKSFMIKSFNSYSESDEYRNAKEPEFEIYDATLSKWISNAKKQAVELAKNSMKDLIGISKASGNAMANEFLPGVVRLILFSIVVIVFAKACN